MTTQLSKYQEGEVIAARVSAGYKLAPGNFIELPWGVTFTEAAAATDTRCKYCRTIQIGGTHCQSCGAPK